MGRGKTTAAINYMNAPENAEKRFMYVTPYLAEVSRVKHMCTLWEPKDDIMSKTLDLKRILEAGKSVSMTHALFLEMGPDIVELIRSVGYTLILDEAPQLVNTCRISRGDVEILTEFVCSVGDDGAMRWKDEKYTGVFDAYKSLANTGSLYYRNGVLYSVFPHEVFEAFEEAFVLTYLSDGQILKPYLQYYGIQCKVVGIEGSGQSLHFSDKPDRPEPVDFSELIHIEMRGRRDPINSIGRGATALSANWFSNKPRSNPSITKLRNGLHTFFRNRHATHANERLWTTYKSSRDKLLYDRKRYQESFLPLNTRSTNEFRGARYVAYVVNRYADPNIVKFFYGSDIRLNSRLFALQEMLQFVWRSAIRDGQEIWVWIPSARMRDMLIDWMDQMKKGGSYTTDETDDCEEPLDD